MINAASMLPLPLALLPEIRDPVLVFAFVLLILLTAPAILKRARLPGLLGLIIAGVLVGPHGLGLLARDRTFELLGEVGLLYLMFLAGLEIELRQFIRERKHSLVFGTFTFLIPQTLGAVGAVYLLGFSWPAGILLASMFASHTLITFEIIKGMGLTKRRPVLAAIGGTILTDTAALLVLTVIAEYTRGKMGSPAFWIRQMSLMVLCVAGLVYFLPKITRWFFRHCKASEEMEFIFILAAVFTSASLAELAGMEPIIGAFLAGLTLGRFTPENGALRNRTEFVGNALFIPFFLLSVGMLVDVRVLIADYRSWMVMLYMSAAVVACKITAAFLAGKILGWTTHERLLVFGVTVNQAAATLAAVLVGYRLEIFGEAVLNGTIMMIMTSCLIGSLATERYGRKTVETEEIPLPPATRDEEAGRRIMVALGSSERVPSLVDLALLIHSGEHREPLYPVTIIPDQDNVDTAIARGEKTLGSAVRRALGAGVTSVPLVRVDHNVATGIQHIAAEHRASMILLGWSGRTSTWGHFFRRTIHDLLSDARATIAVYRPGAPLNNVERMWVLAPPFIERHPGFFAVIQNLRSVARKLQSRLILVTEETRIDALQTATGNPPAGLEQDFQGVKSWKDAARWAADTAGSRDMIAVIGVRAGWRAWQPLIDRLPLQISESKPESNLLLLYPSASQPAGVELDAHSAADKSSLPINSDHILTGMDNVDLKTALQQIVRSGFSDSEQARDLAGKLTEVSRQYPVELAPGVLLLHTHIGSSPDVTVMLGTSRTGIPVSGLDSPVKILVVLVAGHNLPTEDYLKTLSDISRLLQEPGIIDGLGNMSDPRDIHRLLQGGH